VFETYVVGTCCFRLNTWDLWR